MYLSILFAHIAAGIVALCMGLGAIITKKGSRKHIKAGRTYFWSMLVIAVTAIMLSLLRLNLFLLFIALFSFYLTWSGYRAVRWKDNPLPPSIMLFDRIAIPLLMLTGVGMLFLASLGLLGYGGISEKIANANLLLFIFGMIFTVLSVRDLISQWRRSRSAKNDWIYAHIQGMLAAYIATCTAFLVVNRGPLPAFVAWIAPTIIGSFFITYWVRKYRKDRKETDNPSGRITNKVSMD